MIWYSFKPVDTLFFKSAVQAEKGENHEALSIFPPTPHTIAGAIRTTILRQNNIAIQDYKKGDIPEKILLTVGKAGSLSPFAVIGTLLKKDNQIYLPTPYHWFVDKGRNKEQVYQAQPFNSHLIRYENPKKYWVKGADPELENIGGKWISMKNFLNPSKKDIMENESFFRSEIRTGNALTTDKRVHEGRLYSFTHIRLNENCEIIYAINKELPLKEEGILTLGGEQRFGRYAGIRAIDLPQGDSGLFMALTMIEANQETEKALVATGKIIYRGGWDLHIGFHKPMVAYYPAGSVFDQKINENMIQL